VQVDGDDAAVARALVGGGRGDLGLEVEGVAQEGDGGGPTVLAGDHDVPVELPCAEPVVEVGDPEVAGGGGGPVALDEPAGVVVDDAEGAPGDGERALLVLLEEDGVLGVVGAQAVELELGGVGVVEVRQA